MQGPVLPQDNYRVIWHMTIGVTEQQYHKWFFTLAEAIAFCKLIGHDFPRELTRVTVSDRSGAAVSA